MFRLSFAAALVAAVVLTPAAISMSPTNTAHAARASSPTLSGSVSLTDRAWYCRGPVHLASVTVVVRTAQIDAIHLASGCTGTIGRITVVQYHGDGVKIGPGAHDLVVGGGSITCLAHDPGKHQDGIQAMGGQRITFRGINDRCSSANNSAMFVNEGSAGHELPTDIVCTGCTLAGGGFPVRIGQSLRSGIRTSRVCAGKFGSVRISPGIAQSPVDVGTTLLTGTACPATAATPVSPTTSTTPATSSGGEPTRHHKSGNG
jgi:hypothetical protein